VLALFEKISFISTQKKQFSRVRSIDLTENFIFDLCDLFTHSDFIQFFIMILASYVNIWLLSMVFDQFEGLPYNQPIFCPNASWSENATTFASRDTIGADPWDIFVTTNNNVYVPNRSNKFIIVWPEANSTSPRNISLNSFYIRTIFVTEENYIYFNYQSGSTNEIQRLSSNLSHFDSIMQTYENCYDIFIDINNYIYCSLPDYYHQVIRKSLNNSFNQVKIVAGTGVSGSTSFMLNGPNGIFIDTDLDLYVADHFNNRIQLFPFDQSDGITVAGTGSSSSTINLNRPTAVILDANKFVFIVDYLNYRIVGSGPNGFRCLVGCNGSGSTANQLYNPRAISFDTYGNIFIADGGNNRIQKLALMTNSCSKFIKLKNI